MFLEQGFALGQDDRFDAVAHELAVPLLELRHLAAAEDRQGEVQVVVDVQATGQVVLVELVVARLVGRAIENAARAQVIAPGVIAVAAEQGVVEIE
ncbi:hypothetical protein D3C85_927260 [compost metagenome]